MSVITEVRIAAADFELGRLLEGNSRAAIELETLVPSGDATVPLFWVYEPIGEEFLAAVERYPAVDRTFIVDEFEDRKLIKIDWDASQDHLFECLMVNNGQILSATGLPEEWHFEFRFSDRGSLGEFQDCTENAHIDLEVTRVYNPSDPTGGPWFGLSEPQREALTLAVRRGYYDIPRGCTTVELAEELGISDQAVTERLRRAIATFSRQALTESEEKLRK